MYPFRATSRKTRIETTLSKEMESTTLSFRATSRKTRIETLDVDELWIRDRDFQSDIQENKD